MLCISVQSSKLAPNHAHKTTVNMTIEEVQKDVPNPILTIGINKEMEGENPVRQSLRK